MRFARSLLLVISLAPCPLTGVAAPQSEAYYGTPVVLEGLIQEAEGYTVEDGRVPYPALRLTETLSVAAEPGHPYNVAERRVRMVQLDLRNTLPARFLALQGRHTKVSCELFHAYDLRHQSDVVCKVLALDV
ncbi:hypothetical protein GCM10007860_10100 [Chitiniphilus shinanonensis]|uniref:DUF4431 domain-containing protein n=1 Tax=Chitiniphilus shinanonensis TaxID=553088 RepID=A0ABQ6BPB0_9NEIS|nr:DUF4431 domain-containing protein [Chitiniphilus shinanonensis]GLS03865.1 hypothetical protein GCM10007860_10100 [Chitiniphilus shinanonensis]